MIKRIGGNLPLISVVIILVGILRQLLYYANFGLPIKYFLTISEVAIIIAGDLFMIFFITTIYVCIRITIPPLSLAKKSVLSDEEKIKKRNRFILFAEISFTICFAVSITLMILSSKYYSFIRFSAFSFFFLLATFFSLNAKKLVERGVTSETVLTAFVLVFVFLSEVTTTCTDMESVENGKYKGTVIETSDKLVYTSSDSLYFIGKTDKYVFLHRPKDTSNTILPTETIVKMTLKER